MPSFTFAAAQHCGSFDLSPRVDGELTFAPVTAENGARADFLEALAHELIAALKEWPGEVRPGTATLITQAFRLVAEAAIDLDEPETVFSPLKSWSNNTAAELFMTFPLLTSEGEPNKRFALEVSEVVTKEGAQALYNFAVLVTRLVR